MNRASQRLVALLAAALWLSDCAASPPQTLRVGTSGDYAPFSLAGSRGAEPTGFDLEVARAYAADRGLRLRVVRFRWPELLDDLRAGRFEVAMSGVTVRPERSAFGLFSVPVAEGGAVALVTDRERFPGPDALDAPEVRIAVNAGGHLERVARARFPRARIGSPEENREVPLQLAGHPPAADAVVTDVFEAPHWIRRIPGATPLGPFTRDRKAYLLRADRRERAADLDAWLMAREADGSLARLREQHLGLRGATPTARPLAALLAAIDERLALMPLVAEAKRDAGRGVQDPRREARVLEAALAATRSAAARAGRPPPPAHAVRALFEAQLAAAREIQAAVLAGPPAADAPLDLERDLRPALLRIGERIARLLVLLPPDLDPERLETQVDAALRTPQLSPAARRAIRDALLGLASPQRSRERLQSRAVLRRSEYTIPLSAPSELGRAGLRGVAFAVDSRRAAVRLAGAALRLAGAA